MQTEERYKEPEESNRRRSDDAQTIEVNRLNLAGSTHIQTGELNEAICCFEEALNHVPNNPVVLNNLGNALLQMGRMDNAEKVYNSAIDADASYPKPYANLAVMYQLSNEFESAIKHYEYYLELAPHDGDAHHNVGLLYMDTGQHEKASNAFEAAANHLVPDTPERATNVGVGFFFRRELEQAFELFVKAVAQDPTFVPARYHLGVTLLCLGQCAEAIKELEFVLQVAPDYPQAAVNLAVAYNTDGQAEKAIRLLETLEEQQPDEPGVVLNLGYAFLEAGQLRSAAARFRRVIDLPNAADDHVNQARLALEGI